MQAFYNWAIAISDRARMRGRTKEAEDLWKQVTELFFFTMDGYVTVCECHCTCYCWVGGWLGGWLGG